MQQRSSSPQHPPQEPFLVPLDAATAREQHGGKTVNLARIAHAGYRVPDGFVIPDQAFDAFLRHNDLTRVRQVLRGDAGNPAEVDRLHNAVRQASLPPALIEAFETAPLRPGAEQPLAVRSSAIGEDGARRSFAGQLDSVLDVRDRDALLPAIVTVWASALSARLHAYGQAGGAPLQGVAVLVQRQIEPVCSGVVFTRPPDAGDATDALYGEYVAGHLAPLVSGRVTPGRFRLDRATGEMEMLDSAPDKGEAFVTLSTARNELADTGAALEALFAAPQDIEWAITADGALTILQSRPITTLAPCPSARRVVWSSANINENFPQAVTPFAYSIVREGYAHYFYNLGRALGVSRRRLDRIHPQLRHAVGIQQGRLFYNLSNIHDVIRAVPFGDRLTASFNAFVGTPESERGGTDGTQTLPRRAAELGARLRMALTTAFRYLTLPQGLRHFEAEVDRYAAESTRQRLDDCSEAELLALLREFMAIRCHRWTPASLADFAAMVTTGALEHVATKAYPESSASQPHHRLLTGLPDLISAQPVQDLWQLALEIRRRPELQALFRETDSGRVLQRLENEPAFADFHMRFQAYLDQWGFRRSGELLLTIPSFDETPEPLVDILRGYALADASDPVQRLQEQARARVAATDEIAARLRARRLLPLLPWPTAATGLRALLRATHAAVAWRERARLKQALLYTRLRHVLMAIGTVLQHRGWLASSDDVFFLTYREIEDALSGTAWAPELLEHLVTPRAAHFQALPAEAPPQTLHLRPGHYYDCRPGRSEAPAGNRWHGLGACSGRVTGRARVLNDVSESSSLRPGDVLVVRQTDPGWAPVFPLIAGLVVERGGMLSHGAIVAREFGVPAVVGIDGITGHLASGTVIAIDGETGDVHVVD